MPKNGLEQWQDQSPHSLAPSPLLKIAMALIAGIVIARWHLASAPLFLAILMISVITMPLVWFATPRSIRPNRRDRVVAALLCAGFAALGGLRYGLVYSYYPDHHLVRYAGDPPQLASLRGIILTNPYISKSKGGLAAFDFGHGPRTVFTLECRQVFTEQGWQDVSGRTLVVIEEPAAHLKQGQTVQMDCRLAVRRGPANPGQRDRRDFHRAGRNLLSARVGVSEALTVLADAPIQVGGFSRLRETLQIWGHTAIIEDALLAEPSPTSAETDKDAQAFLEALLLGQRHRLQDRLAEVFIRSGSLHFLSVSGLHVGILVGFVWGLGSVLQIPRPLRGALALTTILLLLLLIPPRAPVLRAGIGCAVFCIAYMTRRTTNTLNLLSLAAIVILLLRPLDLFNGGFQLSFVVVLGITTFVPALYKRQLYLDHPGFTLTLQMAQLPPESPEQWSWMKKSGLLLGRYLWGLGAVALIAWLIGLPLTAYHFNRIAPWGILASVALIVPVTLTLLIGFAKLLLSFTLGLLAGLLVWPMTQLSQIAIAIAQWFAQWPFSSINTTAPPIWYIAVFYALLIWMGWSLRRRRFLPRLAVIGLLIWLIAFVAFMPFQAARHRSSHSTFHLLSVGHGCAGVGQLSNGKVVLYDAGSMSNFDVARSVIVPFLRSQGIKRIDALIISHANIDHYSGVIDLCREVPVAAVYISDFFNAAATDASPRSAIGVMMTELEAMHIPIHSLHRGDRLELSKEQSNPVDPGAIQVLWPPAADEPCELTINDTSLVLRINDRYGSILLTGDIGAIPQQLLIELDAGGPLPADALLLPHHGSATESLPAFVQAINPQVMINSSGFMDERNRRKLSLALSRRPVLHTFESGAVEVSFTRQGVTVRTGR